MTKKFSKLIIISVVAIKSGGHRVLRVKCRCGNVFERQARRLNERSTCVKCNYAGTSKFIFWPTDKLKEVIYNPNHTTDGGRDFEIYLDEIKEVFYERQDRKFQEMTELIA